MKQWLKAQLGTVPGEIVLVIVMAGLTLIALDCFGPWMWGKFVGLPPNCPGCGRVMARDPDGYLCPHCGMRSSKR